MFSKTNLEIDEFQNVSVYPLIAEILGLKISEPIDGKFSEVKKSFEIDYSGIQTLTFPAGTKNFPQPFSSI